MSAADIQAAKAANFQCLEIDINITGFSWTRLGHEVGRRVTQARDVLRVTNTMYISVSVTRDVKNTVCQKNKTFA